MSAEGPSVTRQLNMLGPTPLFDDAGRSTALDHAQAADALSKQSWREEASVLVQSLNAGWIEQSTEVALHGAFLSKLFGDLLGYFGAMEGRTPFTMSQSVTTEVDATEADGVLGWFSA